MTSNDGATPHHWLIAAAHGCDQCGYRPPATEQVGGRLLAAADRWQEALRRPGWDRRPAPTTWAPIEYAGHVRDLAALSVGRFDTMQHEDDPVLVNWDHEAAAIQEDYLHQSPDRMAGQLAAILRRLAEVFAAIPQADWHRSGRRSDGAEFTVESYGKFLVHETEHHLHDASGG